jgi:hypothetical protein
MKRLSDKESLYVDSIAEADGIMFLCPVCWKKNSGPVGTHGVICWNPSVPQTTSPINGRWNLVGTGFQDLSLVAGSSSVLIRNPDGSEHWHGYLKDGEVTGA